MNSARQLLAGLLYAGSGLGLILMRIVKDYGWQASGLVKEDWVWLLGAICFGGILGPVLLMFGLQQSSAASASLLLNLEAVLTAVLAWIVFKESTSLRIVLGMFLIVAGGIALSWPSEASAQNVWGPLQVRAFVGRLIIILLARSRLAIHSSLRGVKAWFLRW